MANKKQSFKPGDKRNFSLNDNSIGGVVGYIHSPQTLREFAVLSDALSHLPEMRDRNIDLRDVPNSYRTINYWESAGVLDDYRNPPGQGWRKFSLIDMAFLAIIAQLRENGLSIEKIKLAKMCLFSTWLIPQERDGETIMTFPDFTISILEFAFMRVIGGKFFDGNTYLMIAGNGQAELMTEQDMILNRTAGILPNNYFYMNLNALFRDYIGDLASVVEEHFLTLSSGETSLLNRIRNTSDNETFDIKCKNGKIMFFNRKFKVNPSGELHNLIDDIKYGEITIKIRGSKPVTAYGIEQVEFGDAE